MDISLIVMIFILFLLILLSAVFTAIEASIFNSSYVKLEGKAKEQPVFKKIIAFKKNPERFISTVVLGNNFVNILFSAILTYFALKISASFSISSSLAILFSTIIATFVIVVFGETVPKNIGAYRPEKLSISLYPFFIVVWYLFSPFVIIISALSRAILRLFNIRPHEKKVFDTPEEMLTMIQIGKEEGMIEKSEEKMIYSIFEFGDTLVRDVMTPRVDMISLSAESTKEEILNCVVTTGHSRLPVYDDQIDNIAGMLYIKDLLKIFSEDSAFDLRKIIRPAHFVPETKRVDELFNEMQKDKIQIAMVFDEYGGVSGLITLEDILEEIVGEIADEHEIEEKDFEKIGDNAYLVSGTLSVEDFNEHLNADFSDEEASTIGGIILEHLGRLPNPGEEVNIGKFKFIISKIRERRIVKIKVIILKTEEQQ